jgi:glycosyltransferase involved in cell wall biosynthesis
LPAQLVLAGGGKGPYFEELTRHGSEKIRLLDYVSGAALDELLTNAMLFVLPSEMEGLSLALLEAMGAGLCVLTSDIPENRELVDGVGFTFRSGDAEDLEDMLRTVILNPSVRAEAGRKAQQRVIASYDWGKITGEIENEYLRITGKPALEASASRKRAPSLRRGQAERIA